MTDRASEEQSTTPSDGRDTSDPTVSISAEADFKPISNDDTLAATDPAALGGAPDSAPSGRPDVAGYEMVRVLGRGGMGVVWEAIDARLGRTVALKVHASSPGAHREAKREAIEALWIEARLAAKIAHPGIVPIHEVGMTLGGQPYYTMDLVEGTPLRTLLLEGPLAPLRAIAIAREIAEAIGAAHERGVIHCDLKPGNVMIDADGHARVLDFGLAIATTGLVGSPLGPLRGSPAYMAPEQIAGDALTAATDVYALGAVLYEMLTGRTPFTGTIEQVLQAAALERPAPPSARKLGLGDALDRLCLQCLEKSPTKRPANGRAVVAMLRKIHEGSADDREQGGPRPISVPPEAPPHDATEAQTFVFEMQLASTPEALWPHVANTERFNLATGLPSVEFTDVEIPGSAARKQGRFRALGMDVVWEEHPFEWVHGREHTVFRRYSEGPLAWLRNRVHLRRTEAGGTHLTHEVHAAPRGFLGKLAAFWEIRWKFGRSIERVYRRIDEAEREASPSADPFEPPHDPSRSQAERVDRGVRALTEGGRFDRALVDRLAGLLLHAPSKRLERMRPFALADAWGARRSDVLDLLLFAANAGLVDVAWDLLCPSCYVAHEVAASLGRVTKQAACRACGETYTRDLAGSVELIFRPHAEVRAVETATYCVGSPAMRSHVLVQQVLAPNERRRVEASLPRADLRVRAERWPGVGEIAASPLGFETTCGVRIVPGGVEVRPALVRAGETTIAFANLTDRHQIVRIELSAQKADSVTAAAALAHPAFQGLVTEDLLAHGEHLTVSQMAFLAVAFEDPTAVLRGGDAFAFARFNDLGARIDVIAEAHRGTVFQSTFEGTLVAFASPASALLAAIAAAKIGKLGEHETRLRTAVHAGRCIVVTRGAVVGYFGETIERVSRLTERAKQGEVVVSQAIEHDREALEVMLGSEVARRTALEEPGAHGGRRVIRLTISNP